MSSADAPFDSLLVRRAALPVAAFAGVVTTGIAGFVALADVGVVDAAFWLLDPTSIELHYAEGEHGGERTVKAFALVVFTALVLSGVWIGETVLSTAFGGQIREQLNRMQTDRRIDDLSDHVVICGYGLFGRTVARRLQEAGEPVVAIERDSESFDAIDREAVLAVEGDARNEEVLRRAGVERARGLVAAIDDSNANIQITITARGIAPDVTVVARVGDEDYTSLARRAGADEVVIPEVVSGETVTELL